MSAVVIAGIALLAASVMLAIQARMLMKTSILLDTLVSDLRVSLKASRSGSEPGATNTASESSGETERL